MFTTLTLVERCFLLLLLVRLTNPLPMGVYLCFLLHHVGAKDFGGYLLYVLVRVHEISAPSQWHKMIEYFFYLVGSEDVIIDGRRKLRDEQGHKSF